MLSIPEIATQLIDKSVSNCDKNNSRTIFLVGDKSVGKSTLLYTFLEKNEPTRETLVVEYSFARKSNQKQGIDKTLCHIWEYGGKIETLKNILLSIPVRGTLFYCIMVDLSKIKSIWETLETCVQCRETSEDDAMSQQELIVIGGKYDIFKNYDTEIKKIVCTTLRSFTLINNAHLLFYSSKDPQLLRRGKEMLFSIGFGNGISTKEKSTNLTKPLFIPKGTDSWESIGAPPSNIEQVKMRHITRIPSSATTIPNSLTSTKEHAHPEPFLDSLITSKYNEIRNMESLDMSELSMY